MHIALRVFLDIYIFLFFIVIPLIKQLFLEIRFAFMCNEFTVTKTIVESNI